jgi:predicted molibdopterin-dependent oxidoreductase YjgC
LFTKLAIDSGNAASKLYFGDRLDAEEAGFQDHQRVTVQGNTGKMENVEIIYGPIRTGAAFMFHPEVNAIFKAKTEARSDTPAYKRVPVLVHA